MQFLDKKIFYISKGNIRKENGEKTMGISGASLANHFYSPFLPMMYTNYGGDVQVTNINPNDYYNDINVWYNPAAQWALSQGPNPWMQTPWSPSVSQDSIIAGAQRLLAPELNKLTSQNINSCINMISQTKARLNSKLMDDNLSEAQKDEIEKMLKQLKEQENKLKEITESKNLDPQTAFEKVTEIEHSVSKLTREILKKLNEMEPKKTQDGDDDDDVDEVDHSDGDGDDDDDVDETDGKEKPEKTKKKEKDENFSEDVQAAIDQVYDAMYCWGTKDKQLEEILEQINKDNVMELMLGWNKYHSAEKGESFMEAFMWDADHGQKKKYCRQIARALRVKAEELGVYDKCQNDFAKIDKELGSWLFISNDISKNFDNIIKIIAEEMGSKYGSPAPKAGKKAKKEEKETK